MDPNSRSKKRTEVPDVHKMKIFRNQVGGTFPILFYKGNIYKPSRTYEIQFYEEVKKTFPQLVPWMPQYLGHKQFRASDFTRIADKTPQATKPQHDIEEYKTKFLNMPECVTQDASREHSSGWATFLFDTKKRTMESQLKTRDMTQFVILTDITQKFKKPCVLDIKLGLRHYPQNVNRTKFLRQMKKTYNSTTRFLGFRIGGMQLWDAETNKFRSLNKFYGKKMTCNDCINELIRYLSYVDPAKGKAKRKLRKDLVERILEKIEKLRDVMTNPCMYRFFSSSLLIVYEGYRSQSYVSGSMTPPSASQSVQEHINRQLPPMQLNETRNGKFVKVNQKRESTKVMRERRLSQDDSDVESSGPQPLPSRTSLSARTPPKSQSAPHSTEASPVRLLTPSRQDSYRKSNTIDAPTRAIPGHSSSSMSLMSHVEKKSSDEEEGDTEDTEDTEELEYRDQTNNKMNHNSRGARDRFKYFDPRRVEVKMIDYSNIHPLTSFLPVKRRQDRERRSKHAVDEDYNSDSEDRLWLHDECDKESLPDHGLLLGFESLVKLFRELKDTGSIRKRTDEEWEQFATHFPCFNQALRPLHEVLDQIVT